MNGKRITLLRKEHELTQEQLGKIIGVGRTTINGYENGVISPPQSKLVKLADYFNVTVDYLIGNTDVKKETVLTKKDNNDVGKQLQKILETMQLSQDALSFNGDALDDATRQVLLSSLQNSLELGKAIAKKKYTPKKYLK